MSDYLVSDVKPFIGSKHYDESILFYSSLGFALNFRTDDIAELQLGDCRLYLQNYYQKDWCENSMLHISVNSASSWYDKVSDVLSAGSFGSARVEAPRKQDYGAIVTFVWDPAGILLHFAQSTIDKGA